MIKTTKNKKKETENTDALVDEGAQEFFILCNGTMNSSPIPWEEWSTKMMSNIFYTGKGFESYLNNPEVNWG